MQGEMGPKGEPGTAGNRGPTGRPGKRGKQVRLLSYTHSRQQKRTICCSRHKARRFSPAGDERGSRKWWSHGTRRPAGTGGTSRSSRVTRHRWELCSGRYRILSERRFQQLPMQISQSAEQQCEKQQQRFYLATEPKLYLWRRNTMRWF